MQYPLIYKAEAVDDYTFVIEFHANTLISPVATQLFDSFVLRIRTIANMLNKFRIVF
jgi:hypothetical protein